MKIPLSSSGEQIKPQYNPKLIIGAKKSNKHMQFDLERVIVDYLERTEVDVRSLFFHNME